MKIIGFDVFGYSLPLQSFLTLDGKPLAERKGLVIQLTGEDHSIGLGEIAPLPGFSAERLAEAQRQTLTLKENLLNRRIPAGVEKLTWHFETWLRPFKLLPSVRCGLEMAVLHLLANSRQVPLYQLLGAADNNLAWSSLLEGTQRQLTRQIKECLQRGIITFKLKIGASDIFKEIERIHLIRSLLPKSAVLRLDANQIWDYGQAGSFAKALDPEGIEYLEEPTKDNSLLNEFYKVTQFPYALDESLRELPVETIRELKGVQAFILKPMLLGGFEKALGWARLAKEMGIKASVSSSFETGLGIRALAHLAAVSTEAVGFDTLKYFEQDLYAKPLVIRQGKISTESLNIEKEAIDFRLLEPVRNG